MSKQIKQDLNVELLRIMACLMVIMIHIRPFPFDGDTLRNAVILIFVLNGPAVATFFLISGFFISGSQSLKHIYLRFLKGVILPTAIFVFVLGLIRSWIGNPNIGILESICTSHPITILTDMIQGFLAFDTVRFGIYADHLWYIFSYAGIMLWMPVIHALVKHNEVLPLKITLIIAALHYTLQNLSALIVLPVSITIPETIGKPAMYTIAGWFLYSWIREKKNNSHKTQCNVPLHVMRPIFIATFIVTCIIMFLLQKHIYISGLIAGRAPAELNLDYYFTSWNGMLCALQTLSLSAIVLTLPDKIWYRLSPDGASTSLNTFGNIVIVLGSYTFPIYLIHYVFTNHFRAIEIESFFQTLFGQSSIGLILYSLIYSLFIFALCAILIFIAKMLLTKLLHIQKNWIHKTRLPEAEK